MKKKYFKYILLFSACLLLACGFYAQRVEAQDDALKNETPGAVPGEAPNAVPGETAKIPAAEGAGPADDLARQRQKAMGLSSQNRVDEALAVLDELKLRYPSNVDIDLDRMLVYHQNKRYGQAAQVASQIDLGEVNAYGLSLAADSFLRIGEIDQAENVYKIARGRFPANPSFPVGQALSFSARGRFAEARQVLDDFQAAYPGQPDSQVEKALHYISAQEQKFLSSSESAGSGKPRDPREELAQYQKQYQEAVAYVNKGLYAEAALILGDLHNKLPDNQDIAGDYLASLSWSGQHLAAAALARSLDLNRVPFYVLSAAALSLREAGQLPAAEEAYRQALYRNPGDSNSIGGLAATLARMGRVDEARQLADVYAESEETARPEPESRKELISSLPAEPETIWSAHGVDLNNLGQAREEAVLLARENKFDMALAMLKALSAKFPENQEVLYDYIVALTWAGKYDEAAKLSGDFVGRNVPAYALLAAALSQRQVKNYFMAETMYLEGRVRFPDDVDFAAGRAMTLADSERFNEARKALADYRKTSPEADSPLFQVAENYIDSREKSKISRLVSLSREEAVKLAREGQYDQAIYSLAKLLAETPDDQPLRYDFLTVMSWAGRHKEVADLADAIDLAQAPAYVLEAVAFSYRRTDQYAKAESIYRNSLVKDPYNVRMAEGLVGVLTQDGRFREANVVIDNYKLTLERAPEGLVDSETKKTAESGLDKAGADLMEKQREMAVNMAREGKYEAAINSLTQLYQNNPDNPRIFYDFLTVLSWAGEYNAASQLSVRLNADEAPDYAMLAAASSLRKSGHLPEAVEMYGQGARRFPENSDFVIGQSMALADLGEGEKAQALLSARAQEKPGEVERLAEGMNYAKRSGRRGRIAAGSVGVPSGALPAARPRAAWRDEQDKAVEMARAGHTAEAAAILRVLRERYPQDQSVLGDYIVILTWAKDNEAAARYVPELKLAQAPTYVVSAAGQALNAGRGPEAAKSFLLEAAKAQPRNPEILLMLANREARSGNLKGAMDYILQAEKYQSQSLSGQIYDAKMAITYAQLSAPGALGSQAVSLMYDAPASAGRPTPFKGGSMARGAAQMVEIPMAANFRSWSDWLHWSDEYRARRMRQQEALNVLEGMEKTPECSASTNCQNRVKEAKIKVLYDLNRPDEAISEYEFLKSRGYVLEEVSLFPVAEAYLAAHRPADARLVYTEIALRADAGQAGPEQKQDTLYEAGKGIFWSYLDNNELPSALKQAQNNYKYVAGLQGQGLSPDNWKVRDAALTKGLAYYYVGFLAYSEKYYRKMIKNDPTDSAALSNLAAVLTSRGLPRTALVELAKAQEYNPDSVNLLVQEANIHMSYREWRKAHEILKSLEEYAEFNNGIKQLVRRWETHNLFEARANFNWVTHTENEDSGADAYDSEPYVNLVVFSPPINYDWRVFTGIGWAGGDFAEGSANQFLALLGLEYRSPTLEASLEMRQDDVNGAEFGPSLYGVYMPNDNWYFPFSFEMGSRGTPLRARNTGVTANAASIGAKYYRNESCMIGMNLGYMRFSDGNVRWSLGLNTTQRLWTWYDQYLDAWGGVYTSQNSEDDNRSYFNPKEDVAMDVGLTWGSQLFRKHDKSLRQEFSAGIGNYQQKYYGGDTIWNLGYSQTLDLGDRFSATYGVGYSRRVYDNGPEKNINVFGSVVWRF